MREKVGKRKKRREIVKLCVCVCVTPRCGALSATGGPCCRLPAYPRILLGASHTWVAHSSWTLHIQIAVMNIIREEQRGDVRGACTHTHTHTPAHKHICVWVWCCPNKTQSRLTCGPTCSLRMRHTGARPPPHVHTLGLTCIPPILIKPRRHAQTPTVTLHFHPGARRASLHHFKHRPASSDGSRLRLSASAKQNFYTEQEKQLQTFMKYTLKDDGIKLVEVITMGSLLFSAFFRSAARRALMDEKWVIIPGLTQNNGGQSTMEQAQFQGEPSKGRNLFQRSATSELRLKDEY